MDKKQRARQWIELTKVMKVSCKCGCGLVVELNSTKPQLIPRTHLINLETLSIEPRPRRINLKRHLLN